MPVAGVESYGFGVRRGKTDYQTVSELSAKQWAVISHRGREATDLTHEEARRLVHQLTGEGRHGLCIVTNNAASRLQASAEEFPKTTGIPSRI